MQRHGPEDQITTSGHVHCRIVNPFQVATIVFPAYSSANDWCTYELDPSPCIRKTDVTMIGMQQRTEHRDRKLEKDKGVAREIFAVG